jgi:hypothetical protein
VTCPAGGSGKRFGDRPYVSAAATRLETMPSTPSRQARAKMLGPSSATCSLNTHFGMRKKCVSAYRDPLCPTVRVA